MCAGPADCPKVAPGGGCCVGSGTVRTLDGGVPPATATCADSCPGYAGVSAQIGVKLVGDETRLCQAGADCAGYTGLLEVEVIFGLWTGNVVAFDKCCSINGVSPVRECLPQSFATYYPITCY